jgi:hypothetical protein
MYCVLRRQGDRVNPEEFGHIAFRNVVCAFLNISTAASSTYLRITCVGSTAKVFRKIPADFNVAYTIAC